MRAGIRRMDAAILIIAFVSAGMAALLFWLVWDSDDNIEPSPTPSPSLTITLTTTATLTPSATYTASSTHTPTRLPSDTPSQTPTASFTPTDTASPTVTASFTATFTQTPSPTLTPSLTATLYPEPQVNPIVLADKYAGEPITISGNAQPNDLIVLLDNGQEVVQVQANRQGEWEIELEDGLEAGDHLLALYAVGPRDQQSLTIPLGFIVNVLPTHTHSPTVTASATASNTPRPSSTSTVIPPTEVSQLNNATQATDDPSSSAIQGVTRTQNQPLASLEVTSVSSSTIAPMTPAQTKASPTLDATITIAVVNTRITEVAQVNSPTLPSLTPSATRPSQTPSATSPSETPSRTATNTPNASLLPSTATAIPTIIATTVLPSPTVTPSPSVTASLVPTTPTSEVATTAQRTATLQLVSAPRFDTPQNPYSPFLSSIPIIGSADPNVTVILQLSDGTLLGEAESNAQGQWAFEWKPPFPASTRIEAIARANSGRLSSVGQATFLVELTSPEITRPATGSTVLPGTRLEFRGTAPAHASLHLVADTLDLGEVTADATGGWAITLTFSEIMVYDVEARILDVDGSSAADSNTIRVTVAEGLAPNTGGELASERDNSRLYSILLALLLVMGGASLMLMGRLLWRKR